MAGKEFKSRVLVLDGVGESSLAIVRSLGKRGIEVDVGALAHPSLSSLSRYCTQHFIYPDPFEYKGRFQDAILDRLRSRHYDLVVPTTDLTLCPLMEVRESIEALAPMAAASNEALAAAHSKSQTLEIARRLEIPVPKTVIIADRQELCRIAEELSYPVVVKPDRSKVWYSGNSGIALITAYASSPLELEMHFERLSSYGPVLMQEHVRGPAVGIGALSAQGEVLFAFQFRSLHEVPLTGGTSSYRVSEKVDRDLLNYTAKLMRSLSWTGVSHIEFIREERTWRPVLMEINGRFWASLPLAVAAGADFPSYLFDLMIGGKPDFPPGYKVGMRGRQICKDWEWFVQAMFKADYREACRGLVHLPDSRDAVREILALFHPSERIDTFDISDIMPGLYDCGRLLRSMAIRAKGRLQASERVDRRC